MTIALLLGNTMSSDMWGGVLTESNTNTIVTQQAQQNWHRYLTSHEKPQVVSHSTRCGAKAVP